MLRQGEDRSAIEAEKGKVENESTEQRKLFIIRTVVQLSKEAGPREFRRKQPLKEKEDATRDVP